MALRSGTRLGTYEIVAALGAGGMGEVYRAKDLRLGREVAVKVLPAELSSSVDRLARFEREARTVAGLNHPNIVTLYSVEDEDGVHFLTMELVEGRTLADLIEPGGLPFARVLELAIPLTDALVAAHERGVVHRDLKPANVMLTRDGRVKVLDFGLAKLAADEDNAATVATPISNVGIVMGTVPYMAPEQLRGETVDARTDLFALGIVLYELATGKRPFAGANSADTSSAILRDAPKPWVSSDLPPEFERMTGQCLAKNPRDRIQSALEVNNELRRMRKAVERAQAAQSAPDQPASIAVLPFVNRSADAENEYFSDGLAEELLNVLAKIRGLRVVARSSSFTFKGRQVTVEEVGKALNVAAVLEGSVRKSGNRVRISVQLVRVSDSSHLWSETYDRTLDDIFAVQDDIAHSVVKELRSKLLGEAGDSDASGEARAEVAKAAKGRATDPEAHRLFLLARHLIDRRTPEDMTKAIEFLEQALVLDPEFALARAQLGGVYGTQAGLGWTPKEEGYARAREGAEQALALEPDLAEAHALLGWVRMYHDLDWRGAEASVSRALELDPGNARVVLRAGTLASNLGRLEEAIALNRRAEELDPLRPSASRNLGMNLDVAGRPSEAEVAYRRALMLGPHNAGTAALLSMNLAAQGRGEEALTEAARESTEFYRLWALAIVHDVLGHRAESDEALRGIENQSDAASFQVACVYAVRGDADAAFEWLEQALSHHDSGLAEIQATAQLQSLHGDPRWGPFLKKIGFDG